MGLVSLNRNPRYHEGNMSAEDKLRYWLIGVGGIIALVMLLCPVVFADAYNARLFYSEASGADSVRTRWWISQTKVDSISISSFPIDTTIPLDDDYTYKLEHIWFYPSETIITENHLAGAAAPTYYHASFLSSGGFDSVRALMFSAYATLADSHSVTTFPTEQNWALNGADPYKIEFYWYTNDSAEYVESIIPGAGGSLPSPVTSGWVYLYVDVGEGRIDPSTGTMIPKEKVDLFLQLVGAQGIHDTSWVIVPTLYKKKPDATGRAIFTVPANTVLRPKGSFYELTWSAKDRGLYSWGTIRKFVLDTIPTSINVLQTQEVR